MSLPTPETIRSLAATATQSVHLVLTPDEARQLADILARGHRAISEEIVRDYYSGPPGSFTGD